MKKEYLDLAVKLRHELHQHPELSGMETWTKQHLIDFLRRYTALEIVDRGRWFYAVYHAGEDRPNIAFRADFDALPMDETIDLPYGSQFPGVSHKCGHDGHSASLAAFALEVNERGADKNVYFVFQHAEETVSGAEECAPLMDEARISEIFSYHNVPGMPENCIGVIDGTACCASTGMIIRLTGTPAHASSPEDGKNPCFAIAEMINGIPGFVDPALYKRLVMCTIIGIDAGKEAFGMSADSGRLLLTIRGELDSELDELRRRIEGKAVELAEKYGLSHDFSLKDNVPANVNHKESMDKARRAAKRLGLALLEAAEPSRGSEDFGWFTRRTKGGMFWLGAGEDRAPIHTSEFDFNDGIIPAVSDMYMALLSE